MVVKQGTSQSNVGASNHLQTTELLVRPLYSVEQPPHCDLLRPRPGLDDLSFISLFSIKTAGKNLSPNIGLLPASVRDRVDGRVTTTCTRVRIFNLSVDFVVSSVGLHAPSRALQQKYEVSSFAPVFCVLLVLLQRN